MSDGHVHEELSAWLDGELAASRSAEVEAHLGSCAECAAALGALQNVDHALGTLPLPEVPTAHWDRLQERIAAERAAAPPATARARGGAPRRRRPERWLAASAAAAALLALYLAFGRDPGSTPAPPPIARDEAPVAPPEASVPKPPVEVAREPAPPPEAAEVEAPEPRLPDPQWASPAPEPTPQRDATSLARVEPAPSSASGLPAEPSDEELALAIELETVRDLEVIANLELLEAWLSLEKERSG